MKRINFTEQEDKLIIQAYQSQSYNLGSVTKLKKLLGKTSGTIHRRASELGVVPEHRKLHPWQDWQCQLLEDNAHKSLVAINAMLVRRGAPNRSLVAIRAQMQDMGLKSRQSRIDAGVYCLGQVATLFGVTNDRIKRYITDGMLAAKKRTDITDLEYQITAADLRRLLINHTHEINFAKIDKYWLVDVLTNAIKGV